MRVKGPNWVESVQSAFALVRHRGHKISRAGSAKAIKSAGRDQGSSGIEAGTGWLQCRHSREAPPVGGQQAGPGYQELLPQWYTHQESCDFSDQISCLLFRIFY